MVMSVEFWRDRWVSLNGIYYLLHISTRSICTQLRNEYILKHDLRDPTSLGQVCIMFIRIHSINNMENGKKQKCRVAIRSGAGYSKENIRTTWAGLQIIKTLIKGT